MKKSATTSLIRSINRSLVLDLVRAHGSISRTQIARQLNMSMPTVMQIVEELCKEDLLKPIGKSESTGGRPPSMLAFNGQAHAIIGVDLGGTKLFGVVADLSGTVQEEIYVHHGDTTGTETLNQLYRLIDQLLKVPRPSNQSIRGIGVGAPGITLIPEGRVAWAPSLGWRDIPLKQILVDRYNLPVVVDNDVNLGALGDWWFGAGRGSKNMAFIAIGTGIGAGLIIDGSLYRGHNQAAGEIGYLLPGVAFFERPYDKFGALEGLASATGIVDRARQALAEQKKVDPQDELTAEDVFAAARMGEIWAQKVVDETVDYLALAIANISAILNPELVVLGGGVSQSEDLLVEPITKRLNGVIPSVPKLTVSPLGRRAVAMGAIMLVLDATMDRIVVERIQ